MPYSGSPSCQPRPWLSSYRFDMNLPPEPFDGQSTFVALYEGVIVGWLPECATGRDGLGRTYGGCVPRVLHMFRNRGIGKALYHLGMEEVVRQGAEYGFTATPIYKTSCVIRGEGASWSVWLSSDGAGYRQGSTDVDV